MQCETYISLNYSLVSKRVKNGAEVICKICAGPLPGGKFLFNCQICLIGRSANMGLISLYLLSKCQKEITWQWNMGKIKGSPQNKLLSCETPFSWRIFCMFFLLIFLWTVSYFKSCYFFLKKWIYIWHYHLWKMLVLNRAVTK